MPNYQKGKIYKIYSNNTDKIYYGSTTERLSQRLAKHRCGFKRYKEGKYGYCSVNEILFFDDVKIILVENVPCNSIEELHAREQFYIINNNCVNKQISGRTKEEYRELHKEKNKEYCKKYYLKKKKEMTENNIIEMPDIQTPTYETRDDII
jgi:hypothetical protein